MNILLNAYEYWRYENINKQTFNQIDQDGESAPASSSYRHSTSKASVNVKGSQIGSKKKEKSKQPDIFKKWSALLSSPLYEFCVNVVGVFNILCILIIQLDTKGSEEFIEYWIYSQIVINLLFFVELLSDFFIHGFTKSYQQHFRMWPETMCQFLFLFAVYRLAM